MRHAFVHLIKKKSYLGDRKEHGLTFFYTFLLNNYNKCFKRVK